MRLPAEFEERMKRLLGEEYPAFRESYEKGPYQALRVNSCRIDPEEFARLSPFASAPGALGEGRVLLWRAGSAGKASLA